MKQLVWFGFFAWTAGALFGGWWTCAAGYTCKRDSPKPDVDIVGTIKLAEILMAAKSDQSAVDLVGVCRAFRGGLSGDSGCDSLSRP